MTALESAYARGWSAARGGANRKPRSANPYRARTFRDAWNRGYRDATRPSPTRGRGEPPGERPQA